MGISSGDAQPIERASSPSCAIRWLQGRSNALGGILEMMTSRKNVYRSQSIVCGVVLGWNPRPHLFPPPNLQSPAHCDRGGRQTLRETILLWITSQHTDTNKRLWWAVIWFLSTVFSFLLQIPRLFSNLIYSFCFLQTGRLYDLSRTVNLPLSLYIQYVCVSLYIYIYIYIYMYTIQREIGGQEKEEIR